MWPCGRSKFIITWQMAGHYFKRFFECSDASMSTSLACISCATSDEYSRSSVPPTTKPKQQEKASTFDKWRRDLNLEYKTLLRPWCDEHYWQVAGVYAMVMVVVEFNNRYVCAVKECGLLRYSTLFWVLRFCAEILFLCPNKVTFVRQWFRLREFLL